MRYRAKPLKTPMHTIFVIATLQDIQHMVTPVKIVEFGEIREFFIEFLQKLRGNFFTDQ
jgi:hypothetical protein